MDCAVGSLVCVAGGKYAAKPGEAARIGRVLRCTTHYVDVLLDGEEARIKKTSLKAVEDSSEAREESCESAAFQAGEYVKIGAGNHRGKCGRVVSCRGKMLTVQVGSEVVSIRQSSVTTSSPSEAASTAPPCEGSVDFSCEDESEDNFNGEDPCTADHLELVSEASVAPVSEDGSTNTAKALGAALTTASLLGNAASFVGGVTFQGLAFGGRAIKHIVMAKQKEKEPTCYLKWLFGEDLLEIRWTDKIEKVQEKTEFAGHEYELCFVKVESEGHTFFGKPSEVVRLFYVRTSSAQSESLQDRLEQVAAFGELREACKIASRLHLLVSPAAPEWQFELDLEHFKHIDEPPSDDSGGCGFIGEDVLKLMFGNGFCAKRRTSLQVRIVSPDLGVYKGVLTRKRGIFGIQLPPSMRKVGPSVRRQSEERKVYMLVVRDYPSQNNLQISKWLNGGTTRKSFEQKPLSPMLKRLLTSLQVPSEVVSTYASRGQLRKEAWVVGVADPTDSLPEGHVYISGLAESHIPRIGIDERPQLFVTRSPCTNPEDGHLLPVVTQQPSGMASEDWAALAARHFGEVIFSNKGKALPEVIAEGDLDGDLYYINWDGDVVKHVVACPTTASVEGASSSSAGDGHALGSRWFQEARAYMLSSSAVKTKQLIGKLYRLGEQVADNCAEGLNHTDAKAYFRAYAQAIDAGKHGNHIHLPAHLRVQAGM